MNEVNNYVNVMRKQGQMRAAINPNSDNSLLKHELIEHYKANKEKALALIQGIEKGDYTNITAEQRMHYDAAVIATRGYTNPVKEPNRTFTPANKASELERLKQAGWKPLTESDYILLNEGL